MFFDYAGHFSQIMGNVHRENRYRVFNPLEKSVQHFPKAISCGQSKKDVVLWSTNDYLGLSMDAGAIKALSDQAESGGIGAGGTRNISGTHPLHVTLEKALAALHGKESALLFNSGYAANEWTLQTLGKLLPGCIMLSDAENHASMITGIKAGGTPKLIFRHNNLKHLLMLLDSLPPAAPKIIVCESVYSMSGDFAPLADLCTIARQKGALLYVDEVHAVGLYGQTGGGLSEKTNTRDGITLIQGTLAKAFGTLGGYIAGDSCLVDVIRSHASGFIFSTALPAPILAASLSNIQKATNDPRLREKFWQVVEETREALLEKDLPILATQSHIMPFMVRDSRLCTEMSRTLLEVFGIYLQPINYPTVPKGQERFRITPVRQHTTEMIHGLVKGLTQTFTQQPAMHLGS